MKFTTPCFVRVDNAKKRKELIKWLESIGYYFTGADHGSDENGDCIITATIYDGKYITTSFSNREFWMPENTKSYDCGTNIDLFKALAALRDDCDNNQLFVAECNLYYKHGDKPVKTIALKGEFNINEDIPAICCDGIHKATTEEIIKHFKDINNDRKERTDTNMP